MKPDAKSAAATRCFLKQLTDDEFNQDSLTVFLIKTRELSPKRTLMREIGDFIAHSIRNKGLVLEHLSKFNFAQEQVGAIQITLAMASKASTLISDLCRLVSSMGFDSAPVSARGEELTVCFFGILHLARIELSGRPDYYLKITRRHHRTKNGVQFMSLIAVSPKHSLFPVYYSDVDAAKYLGEIDLDDFDLASMLHVVRDGNHLKLITV